MVVFGTQLSAFSRACLGDRVYNSGVGERLKTIADVHEYWGLGGRLDEDSFNDALLVLSVGEGNPVGVRSCSLGQAESMAMVGLILTTQEQRYLYAVLRERPFKEGKRTVSPERTVPVWILSDQRILAEVFLLTGDMANYEYFRSKYPSIFG